jgi:hypothetical protein
MRFCDVWKEQCDAARQIEDEFGTQKALSYLKAAQTIRARVQEEDEDE